MSDQNQFRIAKYCQAPLRMEARAGFSVSPEQLFSTVSNPATVANWVPLMKGVSMEHGNAGNGIECGIGSIRHCDMRGMGELKETIVWWNPPHGYAFKVATKIRMMLPTEDHVSVMLVESDGNGGSVLTWQHHFNWRGPLLRHMAVVMLPMMMNAALNNLRRELGGVGGRMRFVRKYGASDSLK